MPYEDIILTHFLFKGRHSRLTTRIYAKIKVRSSKNEENIYDLIAFKVLQHSQSSLIIVKTKSLF